MSIKVTVAAIEYTVKQKEGYVLIYKREAKPFGRKVLYWNGAKRPAPKMNSTVARVLAKASRYGTLKLTKGQ